jgi:hypothetical protein
MGSDCGKIPERLCGLYNFHGAGGNVTGPRNVSVLQLHPRLDLSLAQHLHELPQAWKATTSISQEGESNITKSGTTTGHPIQRTQLTLEESLVKKGVELPSTAGRPGNQWGISQKRSNGAARVTTLQRGIPCTYLWIMNKG